MAKKNPTTKPPLGEVASIGRDPRVNTWGGVLRSDDATLAAKGGAKGLDLYDELELDGRTYSVLQKRRLGLTSREWVVEAASEDPRDVLAAEVATKALKRLSFDRLSSALLGATKSGFAVAELLWVVDAEGVWPKFKARKARRFVWTEDGELRLLTQQDPLRGEGLPERKFIAHSFGADDGNPNGVGLGARLFWPVWFKRNLRRFWLVWAEKFGSPTAVAEYPSGATAEVVQAALDAAEAVASEAAVAVPQGLVLKLLAEARTGSADAYERAVRYCDEEIAEIVLGETLTTSAAQGGSRALGEVHNEVRIELVKADADLLSETLNETLMRWLTEFNVPGANPPSVWRVFPEDLKALAERDQAIKALGCEPTQEYITDTYGPGWVKLPPKGAPAEGPAFAAPLPADPAAKAARQALAGSGPAHEALLAPLRDLVANATSLEAIRDGLLNVAGEQDPFLMEQLLAGAMLTANLAGRAEVQDGR